MNKKNYYIPLFVSLLFTACTSTGEATKASNTTKDSNSPLELLKQDKIEEARVAFSLPYNIDEVDEDGNTVLHLAAEKNNADLCMFFMLKGADADLKNNNSDTALHVAIKNNAFEAAEAITAIDSTSLFSRDADGYTALDLALQKDQKYFDLFITTKSGQIRDTDGQSIVHYFVKTRNIKGIQQCVKKSIPISVKDVNGKTPLDIAFEMLTDETSVKIVAELIRGGAEEIDNEYSYLWNAIETRNLNIRLQDGQTPLHLASIMGHKPVVSYLLQNDVDPTVQDSSGATPLHEAVRYGNLDIAQMLIDAKANVNAKDNLGKTPVMLFFQKDKILDTYKFLIDNHADLRQKDMFGDTVLHTAAMMTLDTEITRMLVENGADINARNKEGSTPLSIAVQKNDIPTVKYLTSLGADINTQDTNGNSPLIIALAGSQEMLESVVFENNVLCQDSNGNTPLHNALLHDAPLSKVQYIVSLTKDVNIRNRDGNSPLFIAVLKNRQKVGEILLSKDADIFATNINNNSPLRLALKYGGSVRNWLITSRTIKLCDGSGNSVLHYAAEWQYNDAVVFLLEKGADITVKNANGETPLFSAVKTNNPQIIQTIVDGGADINARDNLGSTVIHTAVRWDAPKSIDKLVALGINVDAQNSSGKSPLSEAVLSGKIEAAESLLVYGADPNCCDSNGVTIIMDAIHGCNKEIVKLLLKNGANPNIQDINGRNSYHEAAYMGEKEIIEIIRNAGGNPLSRDKHGNTPFSIVLNKDFDVIKCVLGSNKKITDSDGNSPLHIVVRNKGRNELLELLIEENYPIDVRNSNGYTALNYAIEENDIDRALILLRNGANPFQMIDKRNRNGITIALEKNNKQMINNIIKYAGDKTDVQGNSILHYAAKTSSDDVISNLIACGVDKSIKNVSGETAFDIAKRWKRDEKIESLLMI